MLRCVDKLLIYIFFLTKFGHADSDKVLEICDIPSMGMPLCQQHPRIG